MAGHVKKIKRSGKFRYKAVHPKPPAPGQTHAEVSKTFGTVREARAWLAEQAVAQGAGTWIDKRRVDRTFADLVEVWRTTRGSELSLSAAARYDQVLRVHLIPALGTTPASRIDRERVRLLLATLKRTESLTTGGESTGRLLAPASVRKVMTVLSAVMSEAVERGIIHANPCSRLRGLPTIERRSDLCILTAEQIEALASAVPPRDRTMILCSAYTGLRAGESVALRRRDVDLANGRIQVERALKGWVDGEAVYGPPKNSKRRSVTLPLFLQELLTEHLTAEDSPDALVFPAAGGGGRGGARRGAGAPQRHSLWVRRVFRPAVKAALPPELHGLRFHDLRHSAASMLIAGGANPKQIAERMGHGSVAITFDVYGHLLEKHDAAVLDVLDGLRAAAAAKSLTLPQLAVVTDDPDAILATGPRGPGTRDPAMEPEARDRPHGDLA